MKNVKSGLPTERLAFIDPPRWLRDTKEKAPHSQMKRSGHGAGMIYTGSMGNRKRNLFTTIFDCHTHLFSPNVIANVLSLKGLAATLSLNTDKVGVRTDKTALKSEAGAAGVQACLLLPTAPMDGVRKVNDLFLKTVEGEANLFTAGTLHPLTSGLDEELERLSSSGIRALKLSSFSQKFDLEAQETFRLFDKIRFHNTAGKSRFFVILDTFYQADLFFGVSKNHLTTPERLGRLVKAFPEINFVAAHMGGLTAPFREIEEFLLPKVNLYLDTSNADHILSKEEFLRLLHLHGPERILFGTDWPWFGQEEEVAFVEELLQEAGFSLQEQSQVFGGNISRLLF
jgi:predicted TIM-barrel fold metal-dependent hydrolase